LILIPTVIATASDVAIRTDEENASKTIVIQINRTTTVPTAAPSLIPMQGPSTTLQYKH
jgi:hypothetical protein